MHYHRWQRHGSPLIVVEPKDQRPRALPPPDIRRLPEHCELHVTRRDGVVHVVFYDHSDAEIVEGHRWHVHSNSHVSGLFYAWTSQRNSSGKREYLSMHVLLMGRPMVDHINHNGLDNRRSNLRSATHAQNNANQRPRKGGASQYKGVYLKKKTGKWRARIKVDGRDLHLGYFFDEAAAARAYDAAARQAFGEYAYPNFPNEVAA